MTQRALDWCDRAIEMYIQGGINQQSSASLLVRRLIDEHDAKYGVGSMTCSIYDTAWASMIAKTTAGQTRWLFPQSFRHILNTQRSDGGWHTSAIIVDDILNTAAALLALCRHIVSPYQLHDIPAEELRHRQDRAVSYLNARLSVWDVNASQCGRSKFELLIPKLLQLLAAEGLDFRFPGKRNLMFLKAKTAAKLNPAILYGNARHLAAHSLEALVGEVDFNRIGQHKISGSIMASPASTAAYLIYCSTWDEEAEAYMSHIVSAKDGKLAGAVPSKFPTTVFEISGVLSVLLSNGFNANDLSIERLDSAAGFLENCLRLDSGVTGFAPYVESDADNTAKAISTLCMLGKPASPQGMVIRYETRQFFKTYTQERSPSFRTNCHVLKALLDLLPANREQMPQIEKTARFITHYWWNTNGIMRDESNTSPNYPIMLMVEAFVRLVDLWESGIVPILDDSVLRDRIFVCLFQALARTLRTQNPDGSWGKDQRCETTAYAVLSLTRLSSFSSAPRVKHQVTEAVDKARKFLEQNFRPLSEPDQVWTGKTTSGSSVLFQAYVLAALQAPMAKNETGRTIENRFEVPLAKIVIQSKYYARQPWFAKVPIWQIQACLVEGYLFLPQLRNARFTVFPSESLVEDKCFDSIPFTWIAASFLQGKYIGSDYLYYMMMLTSLDRQLDDYADNVLGEVFAGCLFEAEEIIHHIFEELANNDAENSRYAHQQLDEVSRFSSTSNASTSSAEARSTLHRFISHIIRHDLVILASRGDQDRLCNELRSYLISRISQLSKRDSSAEDDEYPPQTCEQQCPRSKRLRMATDQTYHAYAFAFLSCLVGGQPRKVDAITQPDFLDSSEQQYLAADLCRHMSIIDFMSSAADDTRDPETSDRDVPERLRSTSFGSTTSSIDRSNSSASTSSSLYSNGRLSSTSPISSSSSAPSSSPESHGFPRAYFEHGHNATKKAPQQSLQLTRLLDHERRCLQLCLDGLTLAGINESTANIVTLFVDVSELSGQMLQEPNKGSSYLPLKSSEKILEHPISDAPAIPPRVMRHRGSVAAARAAIIVPPLAIGASGPTSLASADDGGPMQKTPRQQYSSWNKTLPARPHLTSHPTDPEVFRMESFHSVEPHKNLAESSGVPLLHAVSYTPPSKKLEENTARSEQKTLDQYASGRNNIGPTHNYTAPPMPSSTADANLRRMASFGDKQAMKLAKIRLEAQRRQNLEAHRRTAVNLQAKAMDEAWGEARRANIARNQAEMEKKEAKNLSAKKSRTIRKGDIRRLDVLPVKLEAVPGIKPPPSFPPLDQNEMTPRPPPLPAKDDRGQLKEAKHISQEIVSEEMKMHRRSRSGGPIWKAPF